MRVLSLVDVVSDKAADGIADAVADKATDGVITKPMTGRGPIIFLSPDWMASQPSANQGPAIVRKPHRWLQRAECLALWAQVGLECFISGGRRGQRKQR